MLTSLVYSIETWTLYRRHIKKLDNSHLRCLHRILHTRWQDRISNTAILEQCNITGIKSILLRTQFRWCGHVTRMSAEHMPKRLLYGQLSNAKRHHPGGQQKRYKDQLRVSLRPCESDHVKWEELATDRSDCRATPPSL